MARGPLISQSEAVAYCGNSSNQEASSRRYRLPIRKVVPQPKPQFETSNCYIPPCLAMDKSIDTSCSRNTINSTSSDEGWQHLSRMGYHDSGGTQVHSSIQRGGPLEATSYEVGGCIDSACILDQNSSNKRVRSSPTKNASPNHSIHSSPAACSESVRVVVSNLDLVVTRLKEGIGAGIITDSTTSPIPHYDDKPMSKRVSSPSITLPEVAERLEADLLEFKKAAEERERAEKDRNDAEEKWRVQERQKIEVSVRSETSYALFQAVGQVARQQFNDDNFGKGYKGRTSIIDNNLQGYSQDCHNYDNGPADGLHHLISHIGDQISGVTTAAAVRRNEINAITTLKEAGIPSEIIDEARRSASTSIFARTYVAKQLSTAVTNICGKAAVNCASMDEIKNSKALIISEGTTESLINAGRQISDTLDAAMKRLESILPNQVHKSILNTTTKSPSHAAATNPKERTDSMGEIATSFTTSQRVESSEKAAVFRDKIAMDKARFSQEHKPLLGGSEKVCPRGAELHAFQPTTLYSFDRYMGLEEEEEDYLRGVVPPPAYLQYLHSVPSSVDFSFESYSGGDFPVFKAGQCAGGANTKQLCWEKYPYACSHHFSLDTHKYFHCSTCNKNVAMTVTPDEEVFGMVKPSAPPAPLNSAEQRALASSIAEHSHELATDRVRRQQQEMATFFAGDKTADRQFKFQDVPPMDTRNKLVSQDYHFEKETNCKQQAATVKSGMTLEGAAVLAARRRMMKEAEERLYLKARQNDSAPPRTLSCQGKTLGGAFNHGIEGNEVLHKIEREGYSAFSAKLAEYKLMRQDLVSSIT